MHAMEQLAASLPAEEAAAQAKAKAPAQAPASAQRPPSRRSSARLNVRYHLFYSYLHRYFKCKMLWIWLRLHVIAHKACQLCWNIAINAGLLCMLVHMFIARCRRRRIEMIKQRMPGTPHGMLLRQPWRRPRRLQLPLLRAGWPPLRQLLNMSALPP